MIEELKKLWFKVKRWYHFLRREISFPKKCPNCNRLSITVKKRHNTFRYVENHRNYDTVCLRCMREIWDYADEMWRSYWATVL